MMTVVQRREWAAAGVVFFEITARTSTGTDLVIPVSGQTYNESPLGTKLALTNVD